MDLMERTYLEQLRYRKSHEGAQPILLFSHDWVREFTPLRVEESFLYSPSFTCLLHGEVTDCINNKWHIAKRTEDLGLNVHGGPFPVTYFSCEAALEAVKDAEVQFYVKDVFQSLGIGVQVLTREALIKRSKIKTGNVWQTLAR